jgi:hypothetical protein
MKRSLSSSERKDVKRSMDKDYELAAEVVKQLRELKGQPIGLVARGATEVLSLLSPQGAVPRKSFALANMRTDVIADVMALALRCEQKAMDQIGKALDAAIMSAERWQSALRRA